MLGTKQSPRLPVCIASLAQNSTGCPNGYDFSVMVNVRGSRGDSEIREDGGSRTPETVGSSSIAPANVTIRFRDSTARPNVYASCVHSRRPRIDLIRLRIHYGTST